MIYEGCIASIVCIHYKITGLVWVAQLSVLDPKALGFTEIVLTPYCRIGTEPP